MGLPAPFGFEVTVRAAGLADEADGFEDAVGEGELAVGVWVALAERDCVVSR